MYLSVNCVRCILFEWPLYHVRLQSSQIKHSPAENNADFADFASADANGDFADFNPRASEPVGMFFDLQKIIFSWMLSQYLLSDICILEC